MVTSKIHVHVNQLKLGMFVSDLDRPWLETPFVFQGFRIQRLEDIDRIRKYCEYVQVDVEKSIVIKPSVRGYSAEPQHEKPKYQSRYMASSALEEEIASASEIRVTSRNCVDEVFDDIAHGRAIDLVGVKKVVHGLVDGILRNPDAHVCLTHLKNRDEYTAQHSINVCVLALALGRHVGLSQDQLSMLGVGALMHDIGKIKTPLDVLNKPDRLTDEEMAMMKAHPEHGRKILSRFHELPFDVIDIAFSHHERIGGGGYPRGLSSTEISFWNRLVSIVDVYDAITSDRCYHKGISPTEALTKMYGWRHTDFDPALLEKFIQCVGIYPVGTLVELTSGEIGVTIALNDIQRLRPKISLVLDANKSPYNPARIIDLAACAGDDPDPTYGIKAVLPPGSYNIDIKEQLQQIGKAQLKNCSAHLIQMA